MNIYKNGNYTVIILQDGTKIRKTNDDKFIPSFAENCDVKITDKCSIGCPWCYEGCTKEGKHGDLFKYKFIETLYPYTEMALNGNDLNHPQLEEFLNFLKTKKVFANITVHQKQFINNYDFIKRLIDNKLIYGIGISYNHYNQDFIDKIKEIPNAVLHTINGILSEDDINKLKGNNLKVLVLGYKYLQRGISYSDDNQYIIDKNWKYLKEELPKIIANNYFQLISFDNLSLNQLDVKRLLSDKEWEEFYMGDDGKYTFYIDMVKGEFSKNSIASERYPIGDKTIDEMFKFIISKNEVTN